MDRLLRSAIKSLVPNWLSNVPGLNVGFKVLYAIALVSDVIIESGYQGFLATLPGVGTATALPLHGQTRGLLQGPAESNAAFAARLVNYGNVWRNAGSDGQLALDLQAYLVGVGSLGGGVYPVVSITNRAGFRVTANADRSTTTSTVSWHWDDPGGYVDDVRWESPAVLSAWWSDLWIVIQDPFTHYASFSDPNWTAAWNTGDQAIDTLTPQSIVNDIFARIRVLKGTHTYVREVVFTANPASFVPTGKYGNASLDVSNTQTMQRTSVDAYWEVPEGG